MEIGNSTKSGLKHPLDDETPSTSNSSNKKACRIEPIGEAGKVECKYYTTINNASEVIIGDASHATIRQNSNEKKQDANGELDVRIREQARIDCGNILAPVDLERPIVPVNLEIASEPDRVLSEFDEDGHFHFRKDFVKLYEQPPGSISDTEMFRIAKQRVQEEAKKLFKTDNERKDHVERNGNIIGVVGQPGIGKTTSVKKWVRHALEGKMVPTVAFLFLIFVRNIDFSQQMTLFDLLVSTVLTDWKRSPENDQAWLEKILKDRNVLIALDGFDEAAVKDLKLIAPKVNLYEKADPLNLLLNLISGNLLPFARIIITSRPKKLFRLHPDHRPKFIVQILGLNREGQDELGRQICLGRYEEIRGIMLKNVDAFAYCYVPINFILTIFFLTTCKSDNDFVCMSVVLSFACEKYSSGEQLKGKECNLNKLSEVAWNGFRKMQILFEEADLREVNLDAHTVDSFMNTSVVKSANIKMTLMEGHKRSYFSHLIWQEFFAAMYLMLFASDKVFEESLEHLFDDRWQVVIKFLFGLCNHEAYNRVKCVIPTDCISTRDQWKKKKAKLLKVSTTSLVEQYGERPVKDNGVNKENWQKLLHLCSCVHEANDKDMTGVFAAHLPGSITLYETILPGDISNFFHVVRAARKLPVLNVDYPCMFKLDSLTRFWAEAAASGIKIRNLHLKYEKINDDDLSNIVESLQHVEGLRLVQCGVSKSLITTLAKRWEQTKPQIRYLDLSNNAISQMHTNINWGDKPRNQIGDEGVSCLIGCLQMIRKLDLYDCDISSTGVRMLAKKLLETGHKLRSLGLSHNGRVDDDAARSLKSCILLIKKLRLNGCRITKFMKEGMRSKLSRLRLRMDRIDFGYEEESSDEFSFYGSDETSEESSDEMSKRDYRDMSVLTLMLP